MGITALIPVTTGDNQNQENYLSFYSILSSFKIPIGYILANQLTERPSREKTQAQRKQLLRVSKDVEREGGEGKSNRNSETRRQIHKPNWKGKCAGNKEWSFCQLNTQTSASIILAKRVAHTAWIKKHVSTLAIVKIYSIPRFTTFLKAYETLLDSSNELIICISCIPLRLTLVLFDYLNL
jgi:hypothetical protein